jgi:hypothetical protein
MTYADATDVTNRWGKPRAEIPDEVITMITTRLGDAERMITRRLTKLGRALATDIIAGTYTKEDVIQVEAEAVLALAKNPEGFITETDGSYTYEMSPALLAGNIEITSEQWSWLGVNLSNMSIIIPVAVVSS